MSDASPSRWSRRVVIGARISPDHDFSVALEQQLVPKILKVMNQDRRGGGSEDSTIYDLHLVFLLGFFRSDSQTARFRARDLFPCAEAASHVLLLLGRVVNLCGQPRLQDA